MGEDRNIKENIPRVALFPYQLHTYLFSASLFPSVIPYNCLLFSLPISQLNEINSWNYYYYLYLKVHRGYLPLLLTKHPPLSDSY